MTAPACDKLVVFFTRGMSLEGWHRAGILDRELALYHALGDGVRRLAFVSYGGAGDARWVAALPGADVLPNRWRISANLYSVLAPWLHRKALQDASAFRTHQINGAWCAVVAKLLFRKPLVVRCGFLWADGVARQGAGRTRRSITRGLERLVMRAADRVIVATDADARTVASRYGVDRDHVSVIPNYVDTAQFRPGPDSLRERGRICFVGRLEAEKNVESLLEALRGLPGTALTIVGDGSRRAALEALAREYGLNAEFLGVVPHAQIPGLLNRAEVFVLPSHYEGNPKALVEAMACGVPVVGARSPGIVEILRDRENGLLCGTSPAEIRAAVLELLGNPDLRGRLRQGAVDYVLAHCSLACVAQRERAVLSSIA